MNWTELVPAAIAALYPEAMFAFDYTWSTESGELQVIEWNEAKLGPVDIEAIRAHAEDLASRLPVPESVTPAQAQTALDEVGLLEQLEATIGAHPYARVRIWFRSALRWERNHPYVDALAAELGLDDAQVDDLFRAAARYSA